MKRILLEIEIYKNVKIRIEEITNYLKNKGIEIKKIINLVN